MNEITLNRMRRGPDNVIGTLSFGGHIFATLEDPIRRRKIPGVTAIPAGTYDLSLRNEGGMTKRYAKKFPDMHKGMIWLRDVPDFKYVYIHIGNYPKDTEGCILVGTRAKQEMIVGSTDAYRRMYPLVVKMIEEKGCQITIRDDFSNGARGYDP